MNGHPITAVMAGTPHRYPMLLVDRLQSLTPGRQGQAVKAISANEAHAEAADESCGLPFSLVVDALGQLAIVVLSAGSQEQAARWYLGAIDSMEFGRPLWPGDLVRMEALVQRSFRGTSRVSVRASVGEESVAGGVMVLSTGAGGEAGR
jgi:3-hydroxyacyl-[acyl-carrier-protein] dehydratase